MPGKKPNRDKSTARSVAKPVVLLCRYEELAMRENRLREAAAKRETGD